MKKNRQYYKSKKRVLSRHKQNADAVCAAIRIATEAVMSAMQIKIAMQTPRPKFPSGGIIGEGDKELFADNHGDILMPGAYTKSIIEHQKFKLEHLISNPQLWKDR
jgi:hypothetical protein